MIQEIVNFTKALPEATFSKNLNLKEGLYIFLDIKKIDGKPTLQNVDENGKIRAEDYVVFKGGNLSPLIEKCKERTAFIDPVSSNKAWNRSIFGLSCNPFALCFKNEHYINDEKYSEDFVKEAINEYFKNSKKYWFNVEYKSEITDFTDYLLKNLWDFLKNCEIHEKLGKKNVYIFKKTKKEYFEEQYNCYLQEKIFNKDIFNETKDNITWGVSDNLLTFADNKTFLKHQTATFSLNSRVTGEDAIKINNFFKLDLPKPMPIFVDKEELNNKVFSIYKSGTKKTYTEIIKQLYKENEDDIQNYYLIYCLVAKHKKRVVDLDFVSQFKYTVNKKVRNLFNIKKNGVELPDITINNVFELEFEIARLLFTQKNSKTGETKPILSKHYFSNKIQADKGSVISEVTLTILYKYRKAWYDYIYKSRHDIITCKSFDDILKTAILDDIRLDENFNHDYVIRRKLNLWFSLYTHFSQNQNRDNMENKTVELRNDMKKIVENDDLHIETDAQFAFAAGQLIWKILIQSKSGNRSHALLEPFLQKNNAEHFKLAIARSFDMYKHEFTLYPKKYAFDKLMGDVMGYIPNEKNIKNLLTYMLAGYFSNSIL
jgi:CRISPR-associated protein Csh1